MNSKLKIGLQLLGLILLILCLLFIVLFSGDKIELKVLTAAQWWIIGLCAATLAVAFFHVLIVLINFDAWHARRDLQSTKYKQKKILYLDEHRDLLVDLIKKELNIDDLKDDNQATIKNLGLEDYIITTKKAWISLKDNISTVKTKADLIDLLPDSELKTEIASIDDLKVQIKLYQSIYKSLNSSIEK